MVADLHEPLSVNRQPLLRWLGRAEYEPTWRAMQAFTEQRGPETRDEIWFLEHPPVFTLGMNAAREHVLAPGEIPIVQIDRGGTEYVLCDLGTGARPFGNHAINAHGGNAGLTFHVFMSHLHWDHIMGFPLFTPAYIPGNKIRIYGCHADIEAAFRATLSTTAPRATPFDDRVPRRRVRNW